jgi:hypothetical protein
VAAHDRHVLPDGGCIDVERHPNFVRTFADVWRFVKETPRPATVGNRG